MGISNTPDSIQDEVEADFEWWVTEQLKKKHRQIMPTQDEERSRKGEINSNIPNHSPSPADLGKSDGSAASPGPTTLCVPHWFVFVSVKYKVK